MIYSDFYYNSQKKITIVLVAMAALSLTAFSMFFFGSQAQPSRADKKQVKRHEVINLSSSQAGILWESEQAETGWIMYGKSEQDLKALAYDERDVETARKKIRFHFVQLKNLDRDTVYHYRIVSDNQVVSAQGGGTFTFRTSQHIPTSASVKPAYGKIVQANGAPSVNAIVLYYYPNAIPLAALTKTTGEWLLPLQFLLKKQTQDLVSIDENAKVRIEVIAEDVSSTVISAPLKKTNPLSQTIVVGKNYEIADDDTNVLSASISRAVTPAPSSIDIIFPKESAMVPAVKPLLKGTALAGHDVALSINSKPPVATTVTADKNGLWKYELARAIAAGSYKLTVTTENDKGKKVTLTRNFGIAKSGEQVLGDATGSALLTPTVVAMATATPTIASSSALTGLPNTNISVSPTILPDAGFSPSPVMFVSLALIILGAGFLIVF
jgi:hypothetical protein